MNSPYRETPKNVLKKKSRKVVFWGWLVPRKLIKYTPESVDHLRDQAARKRKLWALQALISRIWPSFFLCCWLSAHKQHIRRVFFRHDIRGGWAALAASPPRWAGGGSRGHFFITHLTPRSMVAPWHHQWQHLRPLHALAQASGRTQYLRAVVLK
jgi:hypothetical protein